ncbi:hypothetical protein Ferpe_0392 [Fervidobacterium pennivorans DSM 9078]|uniref:Uncharacterized protein n=1 Tax=Fervidobacterium pennivorans (strain DSM 9078 / Ven5) TaxID=771875 RepID=H9UAI9_FERPD|nr:hypothetical protein [Fervidobacterium pennivorans]AFG34532.1 hypothetical protein Ferpe_0392 [Fervidobacterium pennivorans DSM 9078]
MDKKRLIFYIFFFSLTLLALVLLDMSVRSLKVAFKKLESTKVLFKILSCEQKGISLLCDASLIVETPGVKNEIEIVQLRVFTEDGKYIGSWNSDKIRNQNFSFLISNAELFGKIQSGSIKVSGFTKVRIDIGKYGLKMNLPIEEEVKISEGRQGTQ